MSEFEKNKEKDLAHHTTRREFLYLTAGAMGAVGAGAAVLPFIKSMNPAADVLSMSTIDVDIANIPKGQTFTAFWRGKPVFIRHRTDAEIKEVRQVSLKKLPDPQTDEDRTKQNPDWLVVVGVCTHLGCIPNQRTDMKPGETGGWFCACHGSKYDASGRIISGPAPRNLAVPSYSFINDGKSIRIGGDAV